jgi:hypothetical protein
VSDAKKLDAATQSPAYLAYSELIGGAIARLVLGDGSALSEVADLQKEQAQLVRNLTGEQK